MSTCPPPEHLQQFLTDGLPPALAESVRLHVRGCAGCQATLDRLTDHTELRRWSTHAQGRMPEVGEGRALQRLRLDPHSTPSGRDVESVRLDATEPPPGLLGPPARPGELGTLGPYRVQAELGRGGMGIVFRALDTTLGRTVAIKVLRPETADASARQRLVREAQFAARFRHDHVVTVYAVVDPPDGLPYLVMEYVHGPTLSRRIRHGRAPAPREAATLLAQAADGVAAAHAGGLLHRDIKPGNLLLDEATGRVKLMDFGLAHAVGPEALAPDSVVAGTPTYMSPEQVAGGPLDPRSDVYSLGVTLYEALTGTPPFRGAPHRVLQQVSQQEPVPPRRLNDAVPRDLETVCLKAMAKEPARRYATAAEFAADLRRWLSGEPIRARPVGPFGRLLRWARRRPVVAGLSAALVMALAGGIAAVLFQWHRAEVHLADARREHAQSEANFRLARSAVDRYLSRVSEARLLNEAGMQPLRRELLQDAQEFYATFVREHGDEPGVRAELGRAYQRLARIAMLTEGLAQAESLAKRAVAVQEQILDDTPDDAEAAKDLAETNQLLSYLYLDFNRPEQAVAAAEKTLALAGSPQGWREGPDWGLLRGRAYLHLGNAYGRRALGKPSDEADRLHREQEACYQQALRLGREMARARQGLPTSQRLAALAANNLADMFVTLGRPAEAEPYLQDALAELEDLTRANPQSVQYRIDWDRSQVVLCTLYLQQKRWPQAEAAGRKGLAIAEELATANPTLLEVRLRVGFFYNLLGLILHQQGRWADAETAFRAGAAAYQRLTDEHPREGSLRESVIWAQINLVNLHIDAGRPEVALVAVGQMIPQVETLGRTANLRQPARTTLAGLHTLRAAALTELDRHHEAAAEWDQALELDPGHLPHLLTFLAGLARRRAGEPAPAVPSGDYAAAVRDLEGYQARQPLPANGLALAARLYALSSERAAADPKLAPADRQRVSTAHAAAAVACLVQARPIGYFRVAGRVERLRSDPLLAGLRRRPDFVQLLSDLGRAGP